MFVIHKIPGLHFMHIPIGPLTTRKSKKLYLITSTILSSKKAVPISAPESPSRCSTASVQSLAQENTQLPIEKLFVPPDTEVLCSGDAPLSARILKGSNIVLSKYAGGGAEVVNAEFVKSSVKTEECPSDGLPEFALVGRSNVGKSSLLNSLVRRKRQALTSKKPGKTQCINHFRINDSWYLVDLPGYGYAAAPYELRTDWDKFTKDYFLDRPTLVSVFLLIDASIPAKEIDLEYAS